MGSPPSSCLYHRTRYTCSPCFGGVTSHGSLVDSPSTAITWSIGVAAEKLDYIVIGILRVNHHF